LNRSSGVQPTSAKMLSVLSSEASGEELSELDWLTAWESAINSRDYALGRSLFDEDVVAFGTFSEMMLGIDSLVTEQWMQIWPYIEEYRFERGSLDLKRFAGTTLVAAIWTSYGIDGNGQRFPRRGRCTIVLRRSEQGWLAHHTHFSMGKGFVARADDL
jgi:ketosteroid isomerase-like protein